MHYRSLWIFLGLIYIGLMLLGSLIKTPDINTISFNYADKFIHFIMYFILVGWFVQLYKKKRSRIIILAGAILLGLLIEYLQEMIAYRKFDSIDEVANTIGAISAFLLSRPPFDSLLSEIDSRLYHLYLFAKKKNTNN